MAQPAPVTEVLAELVAATAKITAAAGQLNEVAHKMEVVVEKLYSAITVTNPVTNSNAGVVAQPEAAMIRQQSPRRIVQPGGISYPIPPKISVLIDASYPIPPEIRDVKFACRKRFTLTNKDHSMKLVGNAVEIFDNFLLSLKRKLLNPGVKVDTVTREGDHLTLVKQDASRDFNFIHDGNSWKNYMATTNLEVGQLVDVWLFLTGEEGKEKPVVVMEKP